MMVQELEERLNGNIFREELEGFDVELRGRQPFPLRLTM